MSRMGNKLITLSDKVKLEVEGQEVTVSGPKGVLNYTLPDGISLERDGSTLSVKRESDDRKLKMQHGLARSLVNNMVIGVNEGFKKQLELFGVGYRGQIAGNKLTLSLGYSNPIVYEVPEGVVASMPDQTHINLEGIDKQQVGEVTATIRRFRKPDAYHGKGVRYVGEQITLKEGKTV